MRHRLPLFLCWLGGLVLLSACSSTGYSTKSSLTVPATVNAPAEVHPEIVPYVPRFVEALQRHGFRIGENDDPRALRLRFEFNPNPFNLRVSVSLWQQGVPVLTASATNSGWGTAMARGTAAGNLASSAAKEFDRQLADLRSRANIVE